MAIFRRLPPHSPTHTESGRLPALVRLGVESARTQEARSEHYPLAVEDKTFSFGAHLHGEAFRYVPRADGVIHQMRYAH